MNWTRLPALALLGLALAAAGCGGDGGGSAPTTGAEDGRPTAQESDAAVRGFLAAMVPHHESAIEMADVAAERAEAGEIKKLAAAIRRAQQPEIDQMQRIHQRLFGTALKPDVAGHEALGLSAEEAGMAGHATAAKELASADPFDRAFVDAMVPHHEGAVAMAEAVLPRTADAELRKLAQAIVDAQTREIAAMNAFRTEEYGGPVAEGGGHGGGEEPGGHGGGGEPGPTHDGGEGHGAAGD